MAITPNEIHVGPANIYINVTPPATGVPPTWLEHDSGEVASGQNIGATLGEAVFTWNAEKTEILAEQVMGVIDMFVSSQGGELTFEAEERSFELMKMAFDNIGNVNDAERMGFYGGGGGSIIPVIYTCVALTSGRRDIPGAFEVLVLYKCVSTAPMPLKYSRTGPSTYEVTLRALPETSRMPGDQIFQFSREKAPQGATLATGATAGTPGTWTPPASLPIFNQSGMSASIVASPLTAWTVGQHVVLGDSNKTHWNGTAWIAGQAP